MGAHTRVEKEIEFISELTAGCRSITEADVERLQSAVAEAAYYKAERRGFAPGLDVSDWLEAESEIKRHMNRPLPTPD